MNLLFSQATLLTEMERMGLQGSQLLTSTKSSSKSDITNKQEFLILIKHLFASSNMESKEVVYFQMICCNFIQFYQLMRRSKPIVEIEPSFTQSLALSPEEDLKNISLNNNSNDRIYYKTLPNKGVDVSKITKKHSFVLSGWEIAKDSQVQTISFNKEAKYTNQLSFRLSLKSPTIQHKDVLSHQVKPEKDLKQTNFKYGRLSCRRKGERQNGLQQSYSRQKVSLINYYKSERIKRRLMNDNMQNQSNLNTIQYPIFQTEKRPFSKNKHTPLYNKFFS